MVPHIFAPPGRAPGGVRRQPGQSIVEMTLVLPLLVLLFCVVMEFGWAYMSCMYLTRASLAGTRVGAAGGNRVAIEAAVRATQGLIANPDVHITVTTSDGGSVDSTTRTTYDYISVQVRSPYSSLTGLVDFRSLAGTTEYRAENTLIIMPDK